MMLNLPRNRMSESQVRMVLFVLKELGCKDIPSLETLHRIQADLNKKISIPTVRHESHEGNVFYANDLAAQIAHDLANPLVRPHLHIYPEEIDGEICECWQAGKWNDDKDLEGLTPMAVGKNNTHFYVNEIAQCSDGSYVVPRRWVIREGELTCDGYKATVVSYTNDIHDIYNLNIPSRLMKTN